jgi:dTDP-4-dehydrorhamnose reductase
MNILLLGGNGLLGKDIYNVFNQAGHHVICPNKSELNLLDKAHLNIFMEKLSPDLIINCAGFTNVNLAENKFDLAFEINCIGTYNLLLACKYIDGSILHFSTDYIFDGNTSEPYKEDSIANPINKYGWTKLVSEEMIKSSFQKHYIIRTSWLFGLNGPCFPLRIIEKLKRKEQVSVVCDQYGCPTYTLDLATALLSVDQMAYGTYHLTNTGETSWYEFAKTIAEFVSLGNEHILSTLSSTQEIAKRPSFSVLSNKKWEASNSPLRDYKEALSDYIYRLFNLKGEI